MCPTNRNRPHYRSIAFCLISLLCILLALGTAPAAANTATYTVSENGTLLFAEAYLINQDSYLLVQPGFLGEDAAATGIRNLTLTAENGTIIEPVKKSEKLSFPKGNYTLTYIAKIENGLIYAKYPAAYNVTVTLPNPYTTGHLILGNVNGGGVITKTDNATTVTYTAKKAVSLTFFDKGREPMLYIFVAGWLVLLLIVGLRYRSIRNKQRKLDYE